MSKSIRCKKHKIEIQFPTEDSEFTRLAAEVSELIKHIERNPECRFFEVKA
ncbi:hypothetical protein [Nitrosopumilus sp. b3]|uniref:hypothetical protein n=1 Tax=Nitrosopumilus sp. b3 TaxID=2109909 RepID=UPI0015F694FB|nr:hypothetical protein [Nitrosopumilus sp. b3]